MSPLNKIELRKKIERSLRRQGFRVHGDRIMLPISADKDTIRDLHGISVQHRIDESESVLRPKEPELRSYIASGNEVEPAKIKPRLIEVSTGTLESDLFRYAGLHWSIPLSPGYGRRLRFLVMDESNGKLIGILGLADPVFSLRSRDEWVGWSVEDRRTRLQHVMDAFVLGAVPPYNMLLCGKLVAMFAASDEVRQKFKRKYRGSRSLISGKEQDGRLALLTTTSALGPSSIYNRLKFDKRLLYEPVGFTRGSGDFHFSNGLYSSISAYVDRYCEPTAKHEDWGSGFRNRREVIRKCLQKIGLSNEWANHGVQRQVFVIPLARNTLEFLTGHQSRLFQYHQSAMELFAWFRERWLLPRAERDYSFRSFSSDEYNLWNVDE